MRTRPRTIGYALTDSPAGHPSSGTWARRAYRNLVYFNEAGKGGHIAARQQPELLAEELRAEFRALR